jgi:plasmid stability protein
MAQALIRNLEDELVAEYKQAAQRNGRSLEAELREALRRARPIVSGQRRQLAEEVRAMLPDFVPGPEGTEIIRWYRDTNGGRWSDAFGG